MLIIGGLQEEVASAVVDKTKGGRRNFARNDLKDVFKFDAQDTQAQGSCGTYRLFCATVASGAGAGAGAGAGTGAGTSVGHGWTYSGPSSVQDAALRGAIAAAGDGSIVSYVRSQHFGTPRG